MSLAFQHGKPSQTILLMKSMSTFTIPEWATVDPKAMGTVAQPYGVSNCVDGKWMKSRHTMTIPHPLDKDAHPIFTIPDTQIEELGPFLASLRKVPKSGLHNPLKNPERYVKYGEISRRVRTVRKVLEALLIRPYTWFFSLISTRNSIKLFVVGWCNSFSSRRSRVLRAGDYEMRAKVSRAGYGRGQSDCCLLEQLCRRQCS